MVEYQAVEGPLRTAAPKRPARPPVGGMRLHAVSKQRGASYFLTR
jgi:hypothetical protein